MRKWATQRRQVLRGDGSRHVRFSPRTIARLATGLVALSTFVLLWYLAVKEGWVSRFLVASPLETLRTIQALWHAGQLQSDISASVRRVLLGYSMGCGAGIMAGIATGRVSILRLLFEPVFNMLRALPAIGWAPVIVLIFGVTETQKVVIVFLAAYFTVWLSTFVGVRAAPIEYLHAGATLGLRGVPLLVRVIIPAALPAISVGLRVAAATTFSALVAAELSGASSGLGNLLNTARLLFRTDWMFAAVVMLAVLGAGFDFVVSRGLGRVIHWEDRGAGRV